VKSNAKGESNFQDGREARDAVLAKRRPFDELLRRFMFAREQAKTSHEANRQAPFAAF
jgi:hypothetical protein